MYTIGNFVSAFLFLKSYKKMSGKPTCFTRITRWWKGSRHFGKTKQIDFKTTNIRKTTKLALKTMPCTWAFICWAPKTFFKRWKKVDLADCGAFQRKMGSLQWLVNLIKLSNISQIWMMLLNTFINIAINICSLCNWSYNAVKILYKP